MRKIGLFLFINLLFSGFLIAQNEDDSEKRAMEREIKTSGNYLYGEAVADTKEEATKAARTALLSEINQEIVNNRDWQYAKSIQAKDVEYNADMIDLMRGNKYRAIAYIKKDNLEVVFDDKAPEINLSDKNTEPEKKKESEKKEEVVVEEVKAEAEKVEIAPVVEEVAVVEAVPEAQNPESVAPAAPETPKNEEKEYYYKNNDLLGQIVRAPSAREVNKILADNKKNGKAMYGAMESLSNPASAYLVVYKKSGELVAILDKSSQDARRDLITGEMKGKDIYTGNQVIWFQIY